jgi:hypothetical protein
MRKEAPPVRTLLTQDELRRFWTAAEGLLTKCAAAASPLGEARALRFLLEGPGTELLDTPLQGTASVRQAVEALAGGNIINTMKTLNAISELGDVSDDEIAAKLASLGARRANELARSAGKLSA